MRISIVVPVYNEAESLPTLLDEISAVGKQQGYELQIIMVDDGSTDSTWQTISQLAENDSRVLGIQFRKNFGKAAALSAGFDACEGDIIFTLDGDLQDDPAAMPQFLEKLEQGADVVSGWKRVRHDPWHKVLPSRVFNAMVSRLTGVKLHDHNCGFKCYKRDVIHEIRLYGEMHRLIPVLAAAKGFQSVEVEVPHRARKYGVSKYGVSRLLKGFLDLLTVTFMTGFGSRPQHVFGAIGLLLGTIGGLWISYLSGMWCFTRIMQYEELYHLHDKPALYCSLALLIMGGQFIAVGLLAEMIAGFLARDVDAYSIKTHTSPSKQSTKKPHFSSRIRSASNPTLPSNPT